MSFSASSNGQQRAEINVTPLIDVLLVLLIIFMIIVPAHPNGVRATAPQPSTPAEPQMLATPIVLQIRAAADGSVAYLINQQPTGAAEVVDRLRALLHSRQDREMFVKGDRNLGFATVAQAISLAHLASADQVGILTPRDEATR